MSEENNATGNPNGNAKAVYILYLVGIVFGLTGIVGVIISYVNKNDGPAYLASHYQFQIRTFWIGLLFMVVGSILLVVLIGYLIWLFWLVWLIVRCVKGMKYLDANQPHPNPKGWMF